MTHYKTDLLNINNNTRHKKWGKRKLPMLLCIGNLDPKVNEVVTVKTSGVVVESAGVPQVTLTFPLRPPLKTFFFLLICA